MAKKAVVLLIALVLVLGVASVAWAQVQVGDPSITADGGLAGTLNAGAGQIKLRWADNKPPEQAWAPVWLGKEYSIIAYADNQGGTIEKVLYIVEIKRNGVPATPDDVTVKGEDLQGPYVGQVQNLGYNADAKFFYWGPPTGFTFRGNETLGAKFHITFKKAGTYQYKIYAVQLP